VELRFPPWASAVVHVDAADVNSVCRSASRDDAILATSLQANSPPCVFPETKETTKINRLPIRNTVFPRLGGFRPPYCITGRIPWPNHTALFILLVHLEDDGLSIPFHVALFILHPERTFMDNVVVMIFPVSC